MKALLSRASGGPDSLRLEEVDDPFPAPGEVVVDVHACALNYPDVLLIQDLYQIRPPRPFAPGAEAAGIVTAIGEDVTGIAVGERVVVRSLTGGLAERIVVPAADVLPIPAAMPFDHAAAMMLTYGTAYYALTHRAGLQAGETVLILGAAGGVGIAAIQLAKAQGARVVAAVSSEEKAAFCRAQGADETVHYARDPEAGDARALSAAFKAACGPGGANVIFDAVGGGYAEPALRAVAWEGRYLVIGFPAGIPAIPLNLALLKNCQIVGVFWGEAGRRDPARDRSDQAALLALYAAGHIMPAISETLPLDHAARGMVMLAERRATGKIIVRVRPA